MIETKDSPQKSPSLIRLLPACLLVALISWYVWFTQYSTDALFLAASRGNTKRVSILLRRGVPVTARDRFGNGTALMMAVHRPGNLSTCRLLLDRGVDVNARNGFGNTALILAASSGCKDIVGLLISRGADVNARSNNNKTALDAARREHNDDVATLLIQAGAR